MKPSLKDIQEMVAALMSVVSGIERARRQGQASTLAALSLINERDGICPSTLSHELGVHPSTVTRQVQALESAGCVRVTVNPADSRSCFVFITDAGRKEIEHLTRIGLQRFASFVDEWDPEEVRTLARLLRKLDDSKAEIRQRERDRP